MESKMKLNDKMLVDDVREGKEGEEGDKFALERQDIAVELYVDESGMVQVEVFYKGNRTAMLGVDEKGRTQYESRYSNLL